jgi:hypothetical protein
MRLKWNLKLLALPAAILLLVTGCGGFSGSKSVSPASFFLPGLMQVSPNQQDQFISPTGNEPQPVLAAGATVERFQVQ